MLIYFCSVTHEAKQSKCLKVLSVAKIQNYKYNSVKSKQGI